ncbi:MAG: hypothetical protein J6T52_01185 [Bacteroidaceae bacterium]|nr:hypothetical protein [Bacteroidaceae bacterium]
MRVKLQALATVVFLIGVLLGFACKLWFPQYWFDAYPLILLFYWLMEMVLSFLIDRKGVVENPVADAIQGKRFMKVLMISKMVKMLLTIILIAVYIILVKEHVVEFVISAVIFYLLNLAVETYVVTKRVKSEK